MLLEKEFLSFSPLSITISTAKLIKNFNSLSVSTQTLLRLQYINWHFVFALKAPFRKRDLSTQMDSFIYLFLLSILKEVQFRF